MNHALVLQLVRKDWYLSRSTLVLCAAGGALAIALLFLRNEVSGFVGLSSAFIVLIMAGIFLPMQTVMNERKYRNRAFVMSLPISAFEYTTAKVLANLGGFLLIWSAVTFTVVWLFANSTFAGLVPVMVVAALTPFVAFSLVLAVAIVAEAEIWANVTMGICNVSYSFAWFFLIRIPGLLENARGPVPVWNEPVLWLIGIEVGVIVLAFVLLFWFQSKKRSFI